MERYRRRRSRKRKRGVRIMRKERGEIAHIQGLLDILHNNGHLSLVDGGGGRGHLVRHGNGKLVGLRGFGFDDE